MESFRTVDVLQNGVVAAAARACSMTRVAHRRRAEKKWAAMQVGPWIDSNHAILRRNIADGDGEGLC
jgi:hypothetical protein